MGDELSSQMAEGGIETNTHLLSSQLRQRQIQASAFVLSMIICTGLSIGVVVCRWLWVGQALEIDFQEKINLNNDSVASLMRLPGLGLVRAAAIVEYRESARQAGAEGIVFSDCNDLVKVRGLGPKTVEGMSRWLEFGQ
jgi:competence ComEA-like helix-hairpin-helix protein